MGITVDKNANSQQERGKRHSKEEKLFAYKNLINVSIVFFLVFMAFNALQNLQTSLHKDPALGFASLCVIYSGFVFASTFLPSIMIDKIGYKYTIFVSIVGYAIFIAGNFHPIWPVHITASFIIGISAAPLWASKASYITEIANHYAKSESLESETIISRFFCIFYLIFQLGQIVGNTISSLVLKPTENQSNFTNVSSFCGSKFTPETNLPASSVQIGNKTVTLLIGIYLGITFLAIVALYFLDPISQHADKKRRSNLNLFASTLLQMKDHRLLLLVPISIFNGLELAFLFGDYTKAYVSCSIGVEMVGFTMICFSFLSCTTSLLIGIFLKHIGTCVVLIAGMHMHVGLLIWLLYYDVTNTSKVVLFACAGIWGICDSIWTTQINSLFGILFPNKKVEALSLYKLWQSIGYVISFAYGNLISVELKLYILIGILLLGMVCYGIVEYKHRKSKMAEERSRKEVTNLDEM